MAEPATSTAAILLTAAGLTVFGVATGLHPPVLVAGFFGGLWALSYQPPDGLPARIFFLGGSAIVAGYLAPVLAAVAASAAIKMFSWWPADITRDGIQYPASFITGFLAIRWIGPALMRRAEKSEVKP